MYVLSPGNCIKLFENVPFSIYIYNFGFRFGLTVMYLFAIQYFTRLGAKMSMKLINCENYENNEKRADSLVYKVNGPCLFIVLIISWLFSSLKWVFLQIFGLYFMQSYIGVFYHALLHRNFTTLRQVLIQRLLISEVKEQLNFLTLHQVLSFILHCF